MKIEKVAKLNPIDRLAYWIQERESIRLKRAEGLPAPWTDDTILQTYRFCNVRRMDDKVSLWLLENWYRPNFGHRFMLPAIAVARHFNKPETLQAVGFPKVKTSHGWREWVYNLKDVLGKLRQTQPIFNGAYMVRGNDGSDKINSVMDYTVQPLVDDPPQLPSFLMEECWKVMRSYRGFGSFMAGQVVADLRHAVQGTFADKHTWAPAGPGSARGLNVTLGRDPNKPMKQEKFLADLLQVRDQLEQVIPESIWSRLELHDIQNCCCEIWKYSKCILGIGKPKQRYYQDEK
jgi:hypothetical protein